MSDTTQSGLSDNAAGGIAYITFLPALVFLVLPPYNTSPYVRFHSFQSLLLNIVAFVVEVVAGYVLGLSRSFIPLGLNTIWPLFDLLWLFVWVLCVIKAVNGRTFKIPVIGALAEKLANK
jgi:uncharacterized membrane protein